jgi:hypothetical protein
MLKDEIKKKLFKKTKKNQFTLTFETCNSSHESRTNPIEMGKKKNQS